MLNVKQGICEYQLLKSFGLTQPENRTLVYQLQGERSNHYRPPVHSLLYIKIFSLILLFREMNITNTTVRLQRCVEV